MAGFKVQRILLDTGEDGKRNFVAYYCKTGISDEEALKLFEIKKNCALKISSVCEAKYELTYSKNSKISEISEKDCTTACGTAYNDDFVNADKNIRGYKWEDGEFVIDKYKIGDIDPVEDVLSGINKIEAQSATYVLAEPVTELTTFAKALIAVGASVSALIGIIILFRVVPRRPKMNSI